MLLTAEQIAQKVGLSNATVSRVLNRNPRVSEAARKAVLEAISEQGQMPKLLGKRTRRNRHSKAQPRTTLGLVEILVVRNSALSTVDARDGGVEVGPTGSLPIEQFFSARGRLASGYYRGIVDGATSALKDYRYRAVLQATDNLTARHLLAEINDSSNKGLLILGEWTPETMPFLRKCQCPIVSFMPQTEPGWPDYVGVNQALGIRLDFEHLRSLGHKKIGYVAGEQLKAFPRERLAAYKMLLMESGLPVREDWIIAGTNEMEQIQTEAERILSQEDRPTAIICGCFDAVAIAIYRAAKKLGLRIPVDLSVAGYEDHELAMILDPPLTTVRVPTQQMGRQAVQLLMMRIERGRPETNEGWSITATPTLIKRESTAPVTRA